MKSEVARKIELDATANVLPAAETDQGHLPLTVLTLFVAALFCYLLA